MLRPVVSMRLMCQPTWLYGDGGGGGAAATKAATPQQQQPPQPQPQQQGAAAGTPAAANGVSPVRLCSNAASTAGSAVSDELSFMSPLSFSRPQGLWPSMSFSLVPVKLAPHAPRGAHQGGTEDDAPQQQQQQQQLGGAGLAAHPAA
jgi:hypothetical protein